MTETKKKSIIIFNTSMETDEYTFHKCLFCIWEHPVLFSSCKFCSMVSALRHFH